MRASLILSLFAAAAIAAPLINVEIVEKTDVSDERHQDRNSYHHHDSNRSRRHSGRLDREEDFDDEIDDDNNEDDNSNIIKHNIRPSRLWRNLNSGHASDKDRRGSRNSRQHHHGLRNSRDRHGRHRLEEDDDDKDIQRSTSDYECILQGDSEHEERRGNNECCHQIGGEQYDVAGRCVIRDTYINPRDGWRTCVLEQRGAHFAECYFREKREIDDKLDQSYRHRHSSDETRRHHGFADERRRHQDGYRRDHPHPRVLSQTDKLDSRDRKDHRDHNQLECCLYLNDENREREVTRQCCNDENVLGFLVHNDQRCQVHRYENADDFEECAYEQGVDEEQVDCYHRYQHNSIDEL